MVSKLKNQEKGFTIIEVLIVLVIAGLIMLIVFLAVPALQRNSRNTARKNEAAALLGATNEFVNNNGGRTLSASGSATANSDAQKVFQLANTKEVTVFTIEGESGTSTPTFTTAILRTGAKCNTGSNPAGVGYTDGGSGRQVALLFAIEDSGGNVVVQCQES